MLTCSNWAVSEVDEELCPEDVLLEREAVCLELPMAQPDARGRLPCDPPLMEFQSLRGELLSSLGAWAHRQEHALQRLSASHKSDLDGTRKEILDALYHGGKSAQTCSFNSQRRGYSSLRNDQSGHQNNGVCTSFVDGLNVEDIFIHSTDRESIYRGSIISEANGGQHQEHLAGQSIASHGTDTRPSMGSDLWVEAKTAAPTMSEQEEERERSLFSMKNRKFSTASGHSCTNVVMMSSMRGSKSKASNGRTIKHSGSILPQQMVSKHLLKKSPLERIVKSRVFDFAGAFIIIAFLVLLGIETDYIAKNQGVSSPEFFTTTVAFNIWFMVELFLRIIVERKDFFKAEQRTLNIMDMAFVLASIVDMVMEVMSGKAAWMEKSMIIGRALRSVRILRVMRIMRLARVLRHVQQFQKMVCLIQSSTSTLLWCLVLLLCLLFMFAVFFTQGFADHIAMLNTEEHNAVQSMLKAHYGSMPRTLSTLFQSMSGGVDWGQVVEPLQRLNPVYVVLFFAFINFSIFGVLNVMTSVFVETTMKSALAYRDFIVMDAQKNKETAVQHLKKVFQEMDVDKDGVLTKDEVVCFLQDERVQSYIEALQIDLSDADTLFSLLDSSRCGHISIDDFCDGCLKLRGDAKAFDVHCMIYDISRFMEKWSDFTEYTVKQFQKMDHFCKDVRRDTITDAPKPNSSAHNGLP